ncbi:cupredoxin domain-containing protein [Ramlibacter sp. MMS24-I3-19]|uniref:cupredoxin domain-containing protein n=1 Tax=Ramlibacter sp. MMS24-I3-19 TaxID=3416606 RepID=UPI003D076C44
MKTSRSIVATAFACVVATGLQAAPKEAHSRDAHHAPAKAEQQDWGIAGGAHAPRRTIEIGMTDAMRFTPSKLQLREGETVRFVVVNRGKQDHEFVIGTPKVLDAHAALMRRFPQMDHDDPSAVRVAPGRRKTLVWTFNRPGEFAFACLVPGHYEGGMTGTIKVMSRKH